MPSARQPSVAETPHERHQIRLPKLIDVHEQPDRRHEGGDAADREGAPLNAGQLWNRNVSCLVYYHLAGVIFTRVGPLYRRAQSCPRSPFALVWNRTSPKLVSVGWWNIIDGRVLAQLQSAHVGDDGPAIVRPDLRRVVGHRAEAVGDHVEEVADRRITEAVLMVGRRPTVPAAHDHPVSLPGAAVARRAVNVEPLLAARHEDRKSTRLNSSHVSISYAVFCLKKKINI